MVSPTNVHGQGHEGDDGVGAEPDAGRDRDPLTETDGLDLVGILSSIEETAYVWDLATGRIEWESNARGRSRRQRSQQDFDRRRLPHLDCARKSERQTGSVFPQRRRQSRARRRVPRSISSQSRRPTKPEDNSRRGSWPLVAGSRRSSDACSRRRPHRARAIPRAAAPSYAQRFRRADGPAQSHPFDGGIGHRAGAHRARSSVVRLFDVVGE